MLGRTQLISGIASQNQLFFKHYPQAYQEEVVSCVDAAKARGVKLAQEAKHILFRIPQGLCLVHVEGDKQISKEKVASFLNVEQVSLANIGKLNNKVFRKGTVFSFH